MHNTYDDNKFGVITRKWFGLTQKLGGDAAAGFTFGTGDPGPDVVKVTRFYPKGPVRAIKFGSFNLATLSSGASTVDRLYCRLLRGASASVMATLDIVGTTSPFAIASIESSNSTSFPLTSISAGNYVTIHAATKETDNGTDLGSTLSGTVAFFIDMVPIYDADKWNSDKNTYQA